MRQKKILTLKWRMDHFVVIIVKLSGNIKRDKYYIDVRGCKRLQNQGIA